MRKSGRFIAVALLVGFSVLGATGTAGAINCGPCNGCCVIVK